MAIVLDGTSGATLPVPLAVAQGGTGSTTLTLTSPVIAGTPTGVGVLTSSTAVASTSGTSIDFTGIPSWAKRITVMFAGVGTSSTSIKQIQLGNTAVVTSGYTSVSVNLPSSSTPTAVSTGLHLNSIVAADRLNGSMVITLQNSSTNTWEATHNFNNTVASNAVILGAGSLTLSSVLDRIRITTVNGTDTFTAGSINILYE